MLSKSDFLKRTIEKVPNFTWSFDEGRFWDLWMFAHILTGVVFGFLFELVELEFFTGLIVSIIIMVLWEVGEVYFKIKETPENRILDVVYGTISYSLAYSISALLTPWLSGVILVLVVALKGTVEYRGWKAYRARISKDR